MHLSRDAQLIKERQEGGFAVLLTRHHLEANRLSDGNLRDRVVVLLFAKWLWRHHQGVEATAAALGHRNVGCQGPDA